MAVVTHTLAGHGCLLDEGHNSSWTALWIARAMKIGVRKLTTHHGECAHDRPTFITRTATVWAAGEKENCGRSYVP
eukprot:CAMPEP_0185185208 /NCGR_PEP_ID=MMETSP1140-20130426/3111_1 /TAXON_ID=298111 /ORGANISM="Pavlova sp., Strain CCMP459" /LENGTH=75 /DNA_ID=CAMNT_0027751357 /DNA_START=65 /DNA_END=289 /DNA_ORIENTATION=+